ncbi:FtsX-like permease family protein [Streptomyces sp. H39-S7]|uniref:FtsX-like permease family protein n=1 Tax=Streptomyces sp. H39-S7 TaxID=3004357 RepID=UPI0022B035A7|nr:ABC transporter permease [Streptomyces sp. H39-S7]MCZ4125996.1 FtsX-like permease family protein [Streptomyces sp. H39-S7]
MNGLARASVRFRPASFAGTFVALLFAAAIMTGCGALLQTGIVAHLTPERYAGAPVVVAADQHARMTVGHGEDREEEAEPLPDRARVDAGLADRIAREPGVAAAVPDVSFPVQSTSLPALTGRDWSATAISNAPAAKAPSALAEGRAPAAGEVVLDAATAHAAKLRTGDTVTLVTPARTGDYRISGLTAERAGSATAWFDDASAGRLAGHPGQADAIAVYARAGVSTEQLAAQVGHAVDGHALVRTGDARGEVEHPELAGGKELLTALGGSFGGIAAMTAVFVVMGTVALAIGQRSREIALLRAIGATPRQIRRTVATEAVIVAPIAGAIGILPGLALAHWWLGQLVDRGAVPAGLRLSTGWIPMVSAVGAGLLSSLVAGYLAARRPSRARPSQALGEAAVERGRPGPIRTVLGLAALAGGIVVASLAAHATGEDAANIALGVVMLFMLCVALLGPVVAWLAATVLGLPLRAGGAPGALAAANARANSRRLASAITPIVLVIAFCGTLVFMQSTIKHASAEQVRDGVVADQIVGGTGAGLPATAADRAARVKGVDAAVGVLRTGVLYRAAGSFTTASTLGVSGSPADLAKVLDLDVRQGTLNGLAANDTVALNRLLADTANVSVGDRIELRLGDGTTVHPRVVALYERGLGLGEVVMPRAAVAGHVSAAYDSQVLVRDTAGADQDAVATALRRLDVPGVAVTDRAGYSAQVDKNLELNAWANRVMAAVLGGFAAVAAANTLVMTVLDRRREVALLRLAGTTRRQVLGMMRWEALLVGTAGLVIGTAIAWATLTPIARGLTGGAPYVPPTVAAAIAGGVLLLGLVATGLPARALLRTRPIEAGAGRE